MLLFCAVDAWAADAPGPAFGGEMMIACARLMPSRRTPELVDNDDVTAPPPTIIEKPPRPDQEDEPEIDLRSVRLDEAAIERAVEAAVGRDIRALREKMEEYEHRLQLRDILGGIGYIIGITGAVFYILGARRRNADEDEMKEKE